MKRLSLFFLATVLAFLAACTTPPTATFNDQMAIAIQSITTARKASTDLLTGGKITVAQDQATQAKLDTARAALEAARSAYGASGAASGVSP